VIVSSKKPKNFLIDNIFVPFIIPARKISNVSTLSKGHR
jgi:hypothetical protein